MKYQAVILNFDRRTVEYVPVKDVPATPKERAPVASSSGSTPPRPQK